MKKIDYTNITDINNTYIAKIYSDELQRKWEKLYSYLQIHHSAHVYLQDVKDILIADFETLTKFYSYSKALSKDEKNAAKRIFNYDYSKKNLKSIPKNNSLSKISKSDKYSSLIADFFIENSKSMNITCCYYCEMNYIFPYMTDIYDKNRHKFIEKNKRMFDLDHFFEKSDSPITALSLYNFIPSCQICNSRIKGQKELDTLYHLETDTPTFSLSDFSEISPSSSNYNFDGNVKIEIKPNDSDDSSNIGFIDDVNKNHIQFTTTNNSCLRIIKGYHLEERYNFPTIKKEALLLEELKQKWTDSRIESIVEYFNNQGESISNKTIHDSIFHDINEDSIFAKLRRDILTK